MSAVCEKGYDATLHDRLCSLRSDARQTADVLRCRALTLSLSSRGLALSHRLMQIGYVQKVSKACWDQCIKANSSCSVADRLQLQCWSCCRRVQLAMSSGFDTSAKAANQCCRYKLVMPRSYRCMSTPKGFLLLHHGQTNLAGNDRSIKLLTCS